MDKPAVSRYCVIGTPVAHSKSPELFARIFAERGLSSSCTYEINEILTLTELERFFSDMREGLWSGCNVTMPWKQAAAGLVDELSDISELTGAVNTIKRCSDGKLYGTSTDGDGLLWAIRTAMEQVALKSVQTKSEAGTKAAEGLSDYLQNGTTVIIGAGGAARSVLAAFTAAGMNRCRVICRNSTNRQLAEQILVRAGFKCADSGDEAVVNNTVIPHGNYGIIDFYDNDRVWKALAEADIVVNCTPLGMIPKEYMLPVPENTVFKKQAIVADAVYNPENTRLFQLTKVQGCICVTGRRMLEGQALAAAEVLLEQEVK